jgi:peptide/nickel transport system ATP-binding protein
VRIQLKGEIPSAIDTPPGCKFHPRCPYSRDACAASVPLPKDAGHGHMVACHRWQELFEAAAAKNSAANI